MKWNFHELLRLRLELWPHHLRPLSLPLPLCVFTGNSFCNLLCHLTASAASDCGGWLHGLGRLGSVWLGSPWVGWVHSAASAAVCLKEAPPENKQPASRMRNVKRKCAKFLHIFGANYLLPSPLPSPSPSPSSSSPSPSSLLSLLLSVACAFRPNFMTF